MSKPRVYIVWRSTDYPDELDDELLVVCSSEERAKLYMEDWACLRVEAPRSYSDRSIMVERFEQRHARVMGRLYCTDHEVL